MQLETDFPDGRDYELLRTGPIQDADLKEINILRNLLFRVMAVPKFVPVDLPAKKNSWLNIQSRGLIQKFSNRVPHGSSSRRRLGKLVSSLPINLRNFIIGAISAPGTGSASASDVTIYSYSPDLGFGLKTSDSPRVSLVIPVHNHWFTTLNCLRALQRNFDSIPYEIILVDDASTDLTQHASLNIRGIQIVRIKSNVGYLRATNLGASYSKAEYIILLNNDTEPISGWLDTLVAAMDQDRRVVICGSTLIYPTGTLQEAGGQIFSAGNAWNLGRGRDPMNGMFRFPREVDYASAASIIVRNSFWQEVNGFDTRYVPAYCEDSDLCLTAWSMGYKVMYAPNSWVIHHEGVSHGTSMSSGLKTYQSKNLKKLQDKWLNTLPAHWPDAGVPRLEYLRNSRGIIFVADRQLPAVTRDAGSIRTIQIMKHLMALGYHVVLTALDPSTTEGDMATLRGMGIEVHTSWRDALDALRLRASRLTHTWLIRSEVFDFFANEVQQINDKAIKVADLMDLNYEEVKNEIKIDPMQVQIAKLTDRTILVSELEALYIKDVLPSTRIDVVWAEYDPRDIGCRFEGSEGLIFVGGFRHSPNVEGILWFANDVVPHLRDLGFNSPMRVVGSGLSVMDAKILKDAGMDILGRQDNLDLLYSRSKVAIVPLLTGRGRKGKIGEALSLGIPVVTTSVGAAGFNFNTTDAIMITDDPMEFAEGIFRIHENEDVWLSMSSFGMSYSAEHLSSVAMLESIKSTLGGIYE